MDFHCPWRDILGAFGKLKAGNIPQTLYVGDVVVSELSISPGFSAQWT